ncbi:hypothetical protein SDC9_186621 [bioreactor metagenome]|uniref:Uncharacterized protein n=1 Tax=bioreactor metagenome TaxID=1076179 RepID=A0A645HJA1_9ZZZZ
MTFATVPLAVHEVTAIAIHLTDGGLQVVHVAFHFAIDRIFGAVFPSTFLPALALVAKLPCRNDVFPFDSAGAILVLSHFVAAGVEIDDPLLALPVDFTSAIEVARDIGVNLDACGLCL